MDQAHEAWLQQQRLLRRFEEACRLQQQPAIKDYCQADSPGDGSLLVELIHTELEWRLKAGEAVRAEEYLERFPALTSNKDTVLDLIAAEFELRRRKEPTLAPQEYRSRFPQLAQELQAVLSGAPSSNGSSSRICPYCWSPVASAHDTSVAVQTCPSCGTTIRTDAKDVAPGPLPAQIQVGKYELLEIVGQGAFGIVYRARDTMLHRIVAVKIPRLGTLASADDVDRFLREARSAAQLRHPDIVAIHDAGQIGNTCYLASEFVPGITLAQRLESSRLPLADATELIARLAEALDYAHHQGVVHRDLKPSNILIDQAGQPHLLDFGLARRQTDDISLTRTGELLGTPAYMSPEQAEGEAHNVDGRADIYSLGVICYQLLTCELPFRGNVRMVLRQVLEGDPRPPRKLNDSVPRDLETICLKAMARESGRRYQTARELADDLRCWQRHEPIRARPTGSGERLLRWCRRRPLVASLAALLAVVFVGGFAGVAWQWRRAEASLHEVSHQHELALKGLAQARAAVDQFHTRVSETKLLNQPGLQPLRKELLQTASEFYQQFIRDHGDSPEMQADLARAYFRLGTIIYQIGSIDEARPLLEQAVAMEEKLVAESPGDDEREVELGKSINNLANMYMAAGDLDKSEAGLQRSLAIFDQLLRDHPGSPDFEFRVSLCQNNLGLLYAKRGEIAKADAAYQRAMDFNQGLAQAHPDHPEYRRELVRTTLNLGQLYFLTPEIARSQAAYDKAVVVSEQLVKEYPAVADYQFSLATGYVNGAMLLLRAGKPAAAETIYRKGMATFQQLVRANPTVNEYQRTMSQVYNALGMMSQAAGRMDLAERVYQEALTIARELARDNPHVYWFQTAVAEAYNALGNLHTDRAEYDAAIKAYNQGIRTLETILADKPDIAEAKLALSIFYANRALAWLAMGRNAEAGSDVDQLLVYARPSEQHLFQFVRAMIQARQHKPGAEQTCQQLYADAALEANRLSGQLIPTGVVYYHYALVFSLSSAAAQRDQKLTAEKRVQRSDQYAARAIEFLAKAKDAHYFRYPGRVERFKSETELNPLRQREDFKKLLAAAEAEALSVALLR